MRRVEQSLVWQRKQLLPHAFIQCVGITVLEVGPAASFDEQGIAREHAFIQEIGEVPFGVPRRSCCQRRAQMVNTRREGRQIFYSIASSEALAVLQVLYQLYCPTE